MNMIKSVIIGRTISETALEIRMLKLMKIWIY